MAEVKPIATTPVVPAPAKAPAAAAKPAPAASSHKAEEKGMGPNASELAELQAPVTRREFLNYAFIGSLGIFFVSLAGATLIFAYPRFGAGEFGGVFNLGPAGTAIPPVTEAPKPNTSARVWVSNTDDGVVALYNVCVHLGCLYGWQPVTNRFECPCHGSKYQKNGTYISGPAPRSLDRFVIKFVDPTNPATVIAQTDALGNPLPIPSPNALMLVDTAKVIQGKTHG